MKWRTCQSLTKNWSRWKGLGPSSSLFSSSFFSSSFLSSSFSSSPEILQEGLFSDELGLSSVVSPSFSFSDLVVVSSSLSFLADKSSFDFVFYRISENRWIVLSKIYWNYQHVCQFNMHLLRLSDEIKQHHSFEIYYQVMHILNIYGPRKCAIRHPYTQ